MPKLGEIDPEVVAALAGDWERLCPEHRAELETKLPEDVPSEFYAGFILGCEAALDVNMKNADDPDILRQVLYWLSTCAAHRLKESFPKQIDL